MSHLELWLPSGRGRLESYLILDREEGCWGKERGVCWKTGGRCLTNQSLNVASVREETLLPLPSPPSCSLPDLVFPDITSLLQSIHPLG